MTPQENNCLSALMTTAHHDFGRGLNNYAYFKVHNRQISEELVQDTFLKTWAYFVREGKIDMMKAFLYHVLNNLIVDEYRKHKTSSLDDLLEKGFEPGGEDSDKLFNILDGKAAVVLINHLPKTYQKVIRMRYVQDLSLAEISLLTGQSKNAIAVQMHRGLKRLRELYKPKQKLLAE